MSQTLRIEVDPTEVSLAETIAAAAAVARFLILTHQMFGHLAVELGSDEAATRYLLTVAEAVARPFAVNVETGESTSTTASIAPRAWSQERLKGWIGGHRAELEAMFGPATVREA